MNARVDVSVILPVFNEAENLPILWQEPEEVLRGLGQPTEVIFVDGSADVIRTLVHRDARVRLLRFLAHRRRRGSGGSLLVKRLLGID